MMGQKSKNGGRVGAQVRPAARPDRSGGACPDGLELPRATRDEYVAGVRDQLTELATRLDELESGMESAGWEDPGGYRQLLEESRLQLRSVEDMTEALEAAADHAWPSLYKEAEEALLEAVRSVEGLAARLEEILPE